MDKNSTDSGRPFSVYVIAAVIALIIVLAEYVLLGGLAPLVIGLLVVVAFVAMGLARRR